jgi:hypothetical protein
VTSDQAPAELQVGGTLNPRRHLYIERKEDAELLNLLTRGEYCNIFSSRQVGKSSLLMHALLALQQRGTRVCMIDVAGVLGSPSSAEAWYVGLLSEIVRQQRLLLDVAAWWTTTPGTANQKLIQFFRDVLLASCDQPLVVFLDEIDHTLKFDYTDDFFTAIRSMYNDRAREQIYSRVAFCLAGVVTPNELIKNRRTTPYNVGRTIELPDFSFHQNDLTPIARIVSSDAKEAEKIVRAILHWTGGHPFLTARFCEQFRQAAGSNASDVDDIVQSVYADVEHLRTDIHFDQILRFLQERLADGVATLELYQRILLGAREPDRPTIYHAQLKLSGLVKVDISGHLVLRNRLYGRIFDLQWVQESLPRHTAARYRRLALTAAGILGLVALSVSTYQLVVVPRRAAAAKDLAELSATANEAHARAKFAAITGQDRPAAFSWLVRDYRAEANRAFRRFWGMREAALNEKALRHLKDGAVEQACIFGSAAAVKFGGSLAPEIEKAFVETGFAALATTVRRVSRDDSVRRNWQTMLEPAGGRVKAIVDTAQLSRIHSAESLRIVDSRSGAVLWSDAFDGSVLFSEDSAVALEILPKELTAWRLKREAAKTTLEKADTVSVGTDLRSAFFDGPSRLVRQPEFWRVASRVNLSFITSVSRCFAPRIRYEGVAFDHAGEFLAIADRSAVRVCDVRNGSTHATIARPPRLRGDEVREGVLFSPDDRLVTTPEGQIYDWRANRLVTSQGGRAVGFSADGQLLLLTDSRDPRRSLLALISDRAAVVPHTRVLSTQTWKEVATSHLQAAAMSPDGRLLVTRNGTALEITDVRDGKRYLTVDGSEAQFLENGRWLLVISRNAGETVRLFDTAEILQPSAARIRSASSTDRWASWQFKFGLTLNDSDEIIPIWHGGLRGQDGVAADPVRR